MLLQVVKLALFCSFSFAPSGFGLAQTTPPLTLEEALNLARQNNLKLRINEGALEKISLMRSELLASQKPQVSLIAGALYAPDSRRFGYDPAITDGGQLNGQLSVEQKIYDGGVRRLKAAQLNLDLEKARGERRMSERDLTAEVKQQFSEILRAEEEIELNRQDVGQIRDYYDLVRSMNVSGLVPYSDVLKTRVDLANTQVSLQKAHVARLNAVLALESAMGIPSDTTLSVQGSLDSLVMNEADSLLNITSEYSTQTIEIQNAQFDIQRSRLESSLATRERRPIIGLAADAGYLSSRNNLTLPADELYNGVGFSVGINATFSLFNGGATRMRRQQADLETASLLLRKQLLVRGLSAQVQTLRLQIESEIQTLDTLRKNTETADENFLLLRSTYAGGGASATDVLAAQQMLRETRFAVLETKASILQLKIQLEQALTPAMGNQP